MTPTLLVWGLDRPLLWMLPAGFRSLQTGRVGQGLDPAQDHPAWAALYPASPSLMGCAGVQRPLHAPQLVVDSDKSLPPSRPPDGVAEAVPCVTMTTRTLQGVPSWPGGVSAPQPLLCPLEAPGSPQVSQQSSNKQNEGGSRPSFPSEEGRGHIGWRL